MDMTLTRKVAVSDGVRSLLDGDVGFLTLSTMEHAYWDERGIWLPKIPTGTYLCVRGQHRLDGMLHDFETFEITGVEGHTGLLFHPGNTESDSEGCILLGTEFGQIGGKHAVMNSRVAFLEFMYAQKGADFQLTVIDEYPV